MKMKMLGVMLAAVTFFAAATSAVADAPASGCDVVNGNGTGTRSQSGAISGGETLTVVATGEQIPVTFTVAPLGITQVLPDGRVSFATSHEFKGVQNASVDFTTFDEITTVPLQNDPSCVQGQCGLVFKLVLKKGAGAYNCGELVSGYDPTTLTTFTSTLQGATLTIHDAGKLCNCGAGGNN